MTSVNGTLSAYRGVRVAVVGASGFVGRWVARLLSDQGAEVQLIVRDAARATSLCSTYGIRGQIFGQDISDSDGVRALFCRLRPSITFNLAGYGIDHAERDEATAYRINAQFIQTLCDAVLPIRDPNWTAQDVVHVGTVFEYGAVGGDLDEDTVPTPITVYGKSKLAGTTLLTRLCHVNGIKGVTARLFAVYGPGEQSDRLLPSLLRAADEISSLPLTAGQQMRDFTYVEDVAEGLLRVGLADANAGDVVNLATGRLTSVRTFVETAALVLRIPADRLQFGMLPTRAEEMQHSEVTLARLRRLTGWAPSIEIIDGVCRTAEFEKMAR